MNLSKSRRLIFGLCLLFGTGLEAQGPENDILLVDIQQLQPQIIVQARYATPDNFMGRVVDGYLQPLCLLTPEAAQALALAQQEFETFGLSLVVYDCYRPQRAVDHFVRWTRDSADQRNKAAYYPNIDKNRLVAEGYIAEQSGHSRGSTVDVGLAFTDGRMLDMGTPWDLFDPRSNTENTDISPEARANRLLLRSVLALHGFRNYPREWWHYTLDNEPHSESYFDLPVGD